MWRHSIPDWLPFAWVLGTQTLWDATTERREVSVRAMTRRIIEVIIGGVVGSAFSLGFAYATLQGEIKSVEKTITVIRADLAAHDEGNKAYIDRVRTDKRIEDAKWDARITRLENCFIRRDCK